MTYKQALEQAEIALVFKHKLVMKCVEGFDRIMTSRDHTEAKVYAEHTLRTMLEMVEEERKNG